MTIQQANQYFAALPDGFADPAQLGALLPASVQQVQFVGVAGTAGKTAVARLLAATNCTCCTEAGSSAPSCAGSAKPSGRAAKY